MDSHSEAPRSESDNSHQPGAPQIALDMTDPNGFPSDNAAEGTGLTDVTGSATAGKASRSGPRLKAVKATPYRPPAVGEPLVWANGRGSLCEALPYFRAFKGSLHSSGLVAQGFLIDQETEHGDVFGAQVVISSVGGGREKTSAGAMVRTRSSSDTATNVRSFKNAYELKSLVAVIAGENQPLYPCQPPHPYAVLGYFHITDMWKAKQIPEGTQNAIEIWRVRLEKADLTEPSWWVADSKDATLPDVPGDENLAAPVVTCQKCGQPSKEIFTAGWFCLNHQCDEYYTFPNGGAINPQDLEYTKAFLCGRTHFTGEIPPIKPAMPDDTGLHGTELVLRRGFVCPECGCCNRRVYWNRWVCENKACQFTRQAHMRPYPQTLLEEENEKFDELAEKRRKTYGVNKTEGADETDGVDETGDVNATDGVIENPLNQLYDPVATIFQRGYLWLSQTLILGGYIARQYFLPDAQGRILGSFTIFSANRQINEQPGGPNELFQTLEVTDIGLRRNPAAVFGHKLEGYTRHFQQNFGARYKFGVPVQSKGFSEAPDVVLRALQRLIWAKKVAVAESNKFIDTLDGKLVSTHARVTDSKEFNELLALGYMEDDKINYHDDGEHELGPVVAALSLGAPSTMSFRPKRKTQFFLPTHTENGRLCYKEVLEVVMKHGDMMVMIGPEIQKIYEHAVNPYGKRRFSLTARYIDPDKMTLQSDKDDAAVKGAIPARARAFEYHGF
ncbi:hypothetical protein VTK56DRAFT_2259 [Thermocarpiscus australiensis]